MRIHVYNDDDIELTTATIDSLDDLPRICREQCGVGDEEWSVEAYSDTKCKCRSGEAVLWVDIDAEHA